MAVVWWLASLASISALYFHASILLSYKAAGVAGLSPVSVQDGSGGSGSVAVGRRWQAGKGGGGVTTSHWPSGCVCSELVRLCIWLILLSFQAFLSL